MNVKTFVAAVVTIAFMACRSDVKPGGINNTVGPVSDHSADTGGKNLTAPVQEKSDEKVLLRLKLRKGHQQQVTYTVLSKLKGVMYNKVTMFLDFKVDSVKTGAIPVYAITAALKSVKAEIDDDLGKTSYNSFIKPDKNDIAAQRVEAEIRPLMNKKMHFSLNNLGKRVGNAAVESPQSMGSYDFHSIHLGFPEKPVGVGESWTTETSAMGALGMAKNTYSISRITKNEVFIDYVMELTAPQTGKVDKLLGNYLLDKQTGMVKLGGVKGTVNQRGMDFIFDISFTGKTVGGWQVLWGVINNRK